MRNTVGMDTHGHRIERCPMFPLGSVLFPHGALPLQVFEPRYVTMVQDCLDRNSPFGIVLIERGSEVGGGDVRLDAGTLASIASSGPIDDGRLAILAVGTHRISIDRWLEDDPYPIANVTVFADTAFSGSLAPMVDTARRRRQRLIGLAIELGGTSGPISIDIGDDPLVASWHLCNAAPLAAYDRQTLLTIDDPTERMIRLIALLDLRIDDLERRIATC